MKIQTKWTGNMQFEAVNELKKRTTMDAHEEVGGEDTAQTPMELLLSALAGCMGINIVKILRRYDLEKLDFDIEGTQAKKWPREFTGIHMVITIGGDIPEKQVKRAVEMSHEQYCGVANSLKSDITSSIILNGKVVEAE